MSRVDHLTVEIYSDTAGKPYVVIAAGRYEEEAGLNPHTEIKIRADSIQVEDYRRAREG
jgi:hypothetical protein